MASGGSSKSTTKDITPQDLVEFRGGLEQQIFNLLNSSFGLYDPSLGNMPEAGGSGGTTPGSVFTDSGDTSRSRGTLARRATIAQLLSGGRSADSPTVPGNATPAFSDIAKLFTAGITEGETAQLENVRGLAGITDAETAAFAALSDTLRGKFLNPNDPTLLGYIEAAQRPLREQNASDQNAARALFTRAGGQNIQSSSPYAAAFADLQGSFYNSLKDTAAQILYPAFQSERQNQMAATQLAPQLAASIAERNIRVLESEGLPRLIEQQGINNALQELDSRRQALAQTLAAAAGLARPVTGSNSSSTNVGILS
jgi:hypothetical protein